MCLMLKLNQVKICSRQFIEVNMYGKIDKYAEGNFYAYSNINVVNDLLIKLSLNHNSLFIV